MELLISTNPNNIKKVSNKNVRVTTSIESAELILQSGNYDLIISDGIEISYSGIKIVGINDYIKNKSNKIEKIIKQQVIAFCSVKGGVGTTTIIKNIAENLPQSLKVLIIDLHFNDGGSDLSYILNLPVIPHIGMYLQERNKKSFEENIIHYKNNIFVLQAPPMINLVKNMIPSDISKIINYARNSYDIVLIDLPNEHNDLVKTAIEFSSNIIVVSSGLISEAKRIKSSLNNIHYKILLYKPVSSYKTFIDALNPEYLKITNIEKDIYKIINFIV